MDRTRRIALIGGAAVAALGATVIGGTALADDLVGGRDGGDADEQRFQQELAQRLDVPADQVERAMAEMQAERTLERVDELEEEGDLTKAQADAIRADLAAGDVEAAMTGLRVAMLEQRAAALVADGTITREQADQVIALAQAGVPLGLGGPGMDGPGGHHGKGHHGDGHHDD